MARLVVLQPYVPDYRVPFFDRVAEALAARGHELLVVSGSPAGEEAARADAAAAAAWQRVVPTRRTRVGGVTLTRLGSPGDARAGDGLVVELRPGSLDALAALLGRGRVAVWGHVGDYVRPPGAVRTALKRWMVRRADVVFAYTETGRRLAVRWGADESRAWDLGNTLATDGLDLPAPSERTPDPKTFAYLGALDAPKRIAFLRDALAVVARRDPQVRVLVAGDGADAGLLDEAVARGQVVRFARGREGAKRELGERALALVNPGRVGLVAVDSFALGLPIVTTDWPYHSAEFEYLEPGVDSVVTADDPAAFASELVELASSPARLSELRAAAWLKRGWPPLDEMVTAFAAGCLVLLEDPGR